MEEGEQQPKPVLANWCKGRMKETAVLLNPDQRDAAENVIRDHTEQSRLGIARSIDTIESRPCRCEIIPKTGNQNYRIADDVKRVRDQFRTNTTRVLR